MKHLFTLTFLLIVINVFPQSAGDTIVVETFNYTQTHGWPWSGMIRDTMIDFPDDPDLNYEKIIMLYNMRCKDGLVSTTSDRNKGCGEWDYSCNTYITDSAKVDSVLSFTTSHYISAFSGTTFDYVETPLHDYYQYRQQNVQIDATNSESLYNIGTGNLPLSHVISTENNSGKSQYLFTQYELSAAGLTSGDIDALVLNVDNSTADAGYFQVKIKHTDKTSLSASDPDFDEFTEVFFNDHAFSPGSSRIQFHTPFNWNGNANIVVEFSFTNNINSSPLSILGENTAVVQGIYTENGSSLNAVNGQIDLPVGPMSTISDEITVSFWSSGNKNVQPINNSIVHAVDSGNNRTLNMHLPWSNSNIYFDCGNDGGSYDRIDKAASPEEYEGNWSHWAFTKNSSSGDMKIYLNGEPWHSGTDKAKLIDIQEFLIGTSGSFDRSYFGKIDEMRIWDSELSEETIQDWMYKPVDATHPDYANLVAYYKLNEGSGSTVNDASAFLETANIDGYMYWVYERGSDLKWGFTETVNRPNITFAMGDYDLTITDEIVTDSVTIIPNIVREYEIVPRYGTMLDDSISQVSVNEFWEVQYQHIYDPEGELVDSIEVVASGTIDIGELEYFRRYPMKFEIMSFVTPYGIWLDFGMDGKTWAVDVTDYGPILKGTKRMTVERGGQWQEDMNIKFLFIVGTPPRDVLDIQQLWRPDSKGYTSILADRSFEARDVYLHPYASAYKIRTVITGHGQQGEFVGRNHFININGNQEFIWKVWTECAGNPIYPQGGTWIYDRAGWCPGQASDMVENDITDLVTPGELNNIDYGLQSASGTSNYIVNNQLVTYGSTNFVLDAAISEVLKPNSLDAKNDRFNPACSYPEIVIQNTGSSTLYTLDLEYYETGGVKETFKWKGELEFLDTALVVLPINDVSFWLPTSNEFVVTIVEANGEADEYAFNNTFKTQFEGVDIFPENELIVIECKTNNYGWQTNYALYDGEDNVLFEWDNLDDNTVYSAPLMLDPGCYKLRINDEAGDGLYWWHSSTQGSGTMKVKTFDGDVLYTFEPEFGSFAIYEFGIGEITGMDEHDNPVSLIAYPNPVGDQLKIQVNGLQNGQLTIRLSSTIMTTVFETKDLVNSSSYEKSIGMSHLPSGIYLLQVENNGSRTVKKIVKR